MNLVNEQDRFLAGIRQPVAGARDDAANISDVGLDAAEAFEFALRGVGDDFGEGGLAGAGRAVEDDGTDPVGFDGAPQEFAFRQDVALAHKFRERVGAHPCGQWGG